LFVVDFGVAVPNDARDLGAMSDPLRPRLQGIEQLPLLLAEDVFIKRTIDGEGN